MASASMASRASPAGAFPARLSARSRRAPRGGASGAFRARLAPRAAVDPERDTILVTGCKERVAQCVVDQLSKNERSAGTSVVVCLPNSCYVGVRNPNNVMAKDLLYPDQPMIDCLGALDAVECVDQSDAKYTEALASATGVILANEYAPDVLEETKSLLAAVAAGKCPNLKRVVLLSHIGVCRRDVDPWKFMNRKTKTGTGVIGAVPKDGGAPLDKWFEAENLVREAAGDFPIADDGSAPDGAGDGAGVNSVDLAPGAFTYTVVRVGDLRGNGPTSVTYGDAMLTLVDNAFDVRMQDIEIEEGDAFEGFTKRLSVAVTANRMLTSTQNRVLNKTFSLISTGPVDRERRKGWDVAKGRSPPPLEDSVVDEEIAPKEEEQGEAEGAPAPVPT